MAIRDANRSKVKIKLGLSAPSGAGKTLGALLIAGGLADLQWDKVCLIDTENSGDFYANNKKHGIGVYKINSIDPPFTPESYIEAIHECEDAGMDVIIIDSMSHEWDGLGGTLQLNEKLGQTKFKGNSWGAWSETTPRHQRLLYTILDSRVHIITTVRNKTETAMIERNGKKEVIKVGIKEIQRDGFEYELSVNLNIDRETHLATPSKDRTELFEGKDPFTIGIETGTILREWADKGGEPVRGTYINDLQYDNVREIINRLGMVEDKVLEHYKIPSLRRMSKQDGGDFIMKFKNKKA